MFLLKIKIEQIKTQQPENLNVGSFAKQITDAVCAVI